ncbi:MAG: alpha/beta fold hydrolase [Rubrivivax sp.]
MFLPTLAHAESLFLEGPCGRIGVYLGAAGAGAAKRATGAEGAAAPPVPLVLLHSVNAAASVAEVRPVFEQRCAHGPVVAFDLPGFGRSERSARAYTPRLMTDALHEVVAWTRARFGTPQVDALALSLSCEFLARAAVERPGDYHRLALASPTGFNGTRRRRGAPGSTLGLPRLHRVLAAPVLAGPLFRQLTRPAVVRYFLRRTFGTRQIDEQLWRDAVLTAREPGAEHAPLHFLSAGLFSADVSDVYERLAQPVWMSHGVRGDFTDYRGRSTVEGRANWRFSVFPTGAIPWFEQPQAFCAELEAFLSA